MKRISLALLLLLLIGCTQKEEPTDCIKQYNRVYVDAVMCLHGDRGCEYIGVFPSKLGSQLKFPYIDYLPIDELQDFRPEFCISDFGGYKICAYCVSDESHIKLKKIIDKIQ